MKTTQAEVDNRSDIKQIGWRKIVQWYKSRKIKPPSQEIKRDSTREKERFVSPKCAETILLDGRHTTPMFEITREIPGEKRAFRRKFVTEKEYGEELFYDERGERLQMGGEINCLEIQEDEV